MEAGTKRKAVSYWTARCSRYQKFCSDIAGQDIRSHGGDPAQAIEEVCNWLRNATAGSGTMIPGGQRIAERYEAFIDDLPALK